MRRSAWSLISARNAGSLMAPTGRSPCSPPCPWLPWQPAQARANTRAPSSGFPLLVPAGLRYGGGASPDAAGPQRFLIPSASTWTWASVSGPPLARAKAGIGLLWAALTARPSEMTCRSSASGTMARKTGSFSGGAGPSLPSAPWQPAQCAP